MRIFLFLLSSLSFLAGFGTFATSKSAIHEIEALLLFLISTVFFVGAAVIEAIVRARNTVETITPSTAASATNTAETARILREHLPALAARPLETAPPPIGARKAVADQTFHYSDNGSSIGPCTAADMRELREADVISDDTLVFREGDTQWRAFMQFNELVSQPVNMTRPKP